MGWERGGSIVEYGVGVNNAVRGGVNRGNYLGNVNNRENVSSSA